MGSAAGVVLFVILAPLGTPLYLVTAIGLTALGVWAADAAESHFDCADDRRIVIDEVVGQLVALAPAVAVWEWASGVEFWLVVTGFVAFRVFDVWKPGPVRWAERRFRGGVGVMADDMVAGALAALAVIGAAGVLASAGAA